MEWRAAGNTAEIEDSTNVFEQQEPGLKLWNVPVEGKCLGQWIGVRESLQENTIFNGENHGFL